MSTTELVERALGGDEKAKEQLFRLHGPAALRLALMMTHGRLADAEDLTQEAFVTCFRRLRDLRDPERFGGWLMTAVRNLGINRAQSERSRDRAHERFEKAAPSAPPASALDDLLAEERAQALRSAFERLPDGPLKETAQLYYFEELDSTDAVADRLGVPKSTVTTRLDRFRQKMKKELLLSKLARDARDG